MDKTESALRAQLAECHEALSELSGVFDFYAQGHEAKGTPDGTTKARRNRVLAEACRAIVLRQGGDPAKHQKANTLMKAYVSGREVVKTEDLRG